MTIDAHELLTVLHSPDPPPGLTSLARRLGWAPGRYTDVEKKLVKLGLAVVGHRGSLTRVRPPTGGAASGVRAAGTAPWDVVTASFREADLDAPVAATLMRHWPLGPNAVLPNGMHVTANGGSRRTGGTRARRGYRMIRT